MTGSFFIAAHRRDESRPRRTQFGLTLNANKIPVAHSQGKLPSGKAALLLLLQKQQLQTEEEGLGRRDETRSAIGSAIEHQGGAAVQVGSRLCLRADALNVKNPRRHLM
ncbi:uncharacterized protein LACBIDRAFT_316326 [Laccaria bicolor S238N-H82]|uniref:Predicted protein n=1 Tax=Laccaria bicolor (strain S238N-H82 / ATCC MYA-4686) TaxID=486041 RepID=B0E0Q4_LACBS|nr:uncharacterized protein LACBIDRAFT_316326 [Laccaria bicolor S238N-H82]EDQ99569.1 predicted protein [Laccaria bicolor S238N-H82]|eukprot:XP_001889793.1 predicted protein [Laccaria bicolor S238N-H82]